MSVERVQPDSVAESLELFRLQSDRCWKFSVASKSDEVIRIDCQDAELPLPEVYDKVELPRPEETEPNGVQGAAA